MPSINDEMNRIDWIADMLVKEIAERFVQETGENITTIGAMKSDKGKLTVRVFLNQKYINYVDECINNMSADSRGKDAR